MSYYVMSLFIGNKNHSLFLYIHAHIHIFLKVSIINLNSALSQSRISFNNSYLFQLSRFLFSQKLHDQYSSHRNRNCHGSFAVKKDNYQLINFKRHEYLIGPFHYHLKSGALKDQIKSEQFQETECCAMHF